MNNEIIEVLTKMLECEGNTDSCNCDCSKCSLSTRAVDRSNALITAIETLKGKDTKFPVNSALDHIHNVVAENSFNEGYDAGYTEGYERGKADAALSANILVRRLMANFDDVLSIGDVLEEFNILGKTAKGE